MDFKSRRRISNQRFNIVNDVKKGCESVNPAHNSGEVEWNEKNKARYFRHFIVYERFKTIYCYIPKVSSSSWKLVFLNASGILNSTMSSLAVTGEAREVWIHWMSGSHFKKLGHYSRDEILHKLKHYFKFMLVRHPLDRLLSAYKDKFWLVENMGNPAQQVYRDFADRIRDHAHKKDLLKQDVIRPEKETISVDDFLDYVADEDIHINEHWKSYMDLCHPCSLQYDFISRTEDNNYVKELMTQIPSFPRNIPLNKIHVHDGNQSKTKSQNKTPNNIPVRLLNRFQADFNIFGYMNTSP